MDELGARLAEWSADARLADAVAERSRRRWLEQQAVEDASLRGVLRDLAERRADVAVSLVHGAAKSGRITSAGADFLALDESTLVPLHAVAAVRAVRVAGADAVGGEGLGLAAVLGRLAGERPAVHVETADGGRVTGVLHAAGGDVVVVAVEHDERPAAYVPLAAVAAVTLL